MLVVFWPLRCLLGLSLLLVLAACVPDGPQITETSTPTIVIPATSDFSNSVTVAPSVTPTRISLATRTPCSEDTPTSTATPTSSPTLLPTSYPTGIPSGVAVPPPSEVIAPESASRVTELARWGKGKVYQVAYSDNGQLLAVATSLGIYLHDARTLTEIGSIPANASVIAVSPDGRTVAGVISDTDCQCARSGSVWLWSINDAQAPLILSIDREYVRSLVFSTDGQTLTIIEQERITQIQTSDGSLLGSYELSSTAAAFSPIDETLAVGMPGAIKLLTIDGRVLDDIVFPETYRNWERASSIATNGQVVAALTVENGTVFIWQVRAKRLMTIPGFGYGNVALSPDGSIVAAGYEDGWVRLYRASDGRLLHTLKAHDIFEAVPAFSPDGSTLITSSQDGVVRLWRPSDGTLLRSLPAHSYPAPSSPLAVNTSVLASATGRTIELRRMTDGSIQYVFEVPANGNPRTNFEGPTGRVASLALSPDGQILASGIDDGLIHLWRVSDGQLLKTLDNACSIWEHMDFSPDSQWLAVRGYSLGCNSVQVLRVRDGSAILSREDGGVFSLSPDGQVIAIASTGSYQSPQETVELWRVNDGTLLKTLEVNRRSIRQLAFAPDGQMLAVTTDLGVVQLWRVADGTLLHDLAGHTREVFQAVFSPDGKILATASGDGTSRLWNTTEGRLLHILDEGAGRGSRLSFSLDGSLIASATGDAAIRLWRVGDGILLQTFYGAQGGDALTFLTDKLLLSGAADGAVRLWGVP